LFRAKRKHVLGEQGSLYRYKTYPFYPHIATVELPLDDLEMVDLGSTDDLLLDEDDGGLDASLGELSLEVETPQEDIQEIISEIKTHIDRKEIVTASKLLVKFSVDSTELNDMRQVISSALKKRDQLIQELELLENEDKFSEAYALFEEIKEIAIDTPALSDIGERLRQSQAMLDTFTSKPPSDKEEPEQLAKKDKKSRKEKKSAEVSAKKKTRSSVRSGITGKSLTNIPVKPILAVLALLGIIIGAVFLYARDVKIVTKAEADWKQARSLAERKQFEEAERKAAEALTALKSVLIPGIGKSDLQSDITSLLNSTNFQEGVSGKAKYKELYLPVEEVNRRQQLDKLIASAESLIKNEKINKALSAYEKAQEFAEKNMLLEQAATLKEKVNHLRMKETMRDASKAESAGEWENAAATYQQAFALSQTLANEKEKEIINKKLASAAFNHERNQSKKSFTGSQWQQAVEILERAQKLLRENPGKA
ncbi:MAG: hypothetical protein D3924_18715, partial [Candidatus Electrothrix sp. AR4]|nr:hypothetical protein [Candidatus Electrothrix sp. AR4]